MHFIERHRGGERALLVHVYRQDPTDKEEFITLANSAGVKVIDVISVHRQRFDPTYLIGKGKVEKLVEQVKEKKVEVVLFSHPLTPAQARHLEEQTEVRVLDRTELILDIFASRARSYEGRLQVELAQLEHLSSRLVRGWTHLERQKGGIGLRGPGETQLETDRRLLGHRIKTIKRNLDKVILQREQNRRARKRQEIPTVALVGYTNAGKSSLFNQLTKAEVYVKDQLFATLDPTIRRIRLVHYGDILLADTVGFVSHLPHTLVAAFKATLEEVCQAALLLHVVDVADERHSNMMAAVNEVLAEIGAAQIPQIEVLNKIDLKPGGQAKLYRDEMGKVKRVWLSAETGQGIDLLQQAILDGLSIHLKKYHLRLDQAQGELRAYLYQQGFVLQERMSDTGEWELEIEMEESAFQALNKRYGLQIDIAGEAE